MQFDNKTWLSDAEHPDIDDQHGKPNSADKGKGQQPWYPNIQRHAPNASCDFEASQLAMFDKEQYGSDAFDLYCASRHIKAKVDNLSFSYAKSHKVLNAIHLPIVDKGITALIGASGCGKSTLLRCFNRMHDLYAGCQYEGAIWLYPRHLNLIARNTSPLEARLNVGMVFQKPNPFPKSIYDNVAAGLKIRGVTHKADIDQQVETALKAAALWDEVKDRLSKSALALSGGQQQRLCIARALAVEPELLLLDEPTSALDPIATARIEELMLTLSGQTTVLVVTHNMQQAKRISDVTAFMHLGDLVEVQETDRLFSAPKESKTADYLTGRFG